MSNSRLKRVFAHLYHASTKYFFEGRKRISVHKDNFVAKLLWKGTNWKFIFRWSMITDMFCKLAKALIRCRICLVHDSWFLTYRKVHLRGAHAAPKASIRHTKLRFTRISNSSPALKLPSCEMVVLINMNTYRLTHGTLQRSQTSKHSWRKIIQLFWTELQATDILKTCWTWI